MIKKDENIIKRIVVILHYWCFVHYTECPRGSYKNTISNSKCLQCPSNSISNAERTTCHCDEGFYSFETVLKAGCKGNEKYFTCPSLPHYRGILNFNKQNSSFS